MPTKSQGVIGIFSSRKNAEYVIKALVEMADFQQELFSIVTDNTTRFSVMMSGSLESVKSAKVFLLGSAPEREDADEELRRASQTATQVKALSNFGHSPGFFKL